MGEHLRFIKELSKFICERDEDMNVAQSLTLMKMLRAELDKQIAEYEGNGEAV